MDTDIFIQSGDPWHPESASRHNMVNDAINAFSKIGPASELSGLEKAQYCILCRNAGEKKIPAYSYVTIDTPDDSETPFLNRMLPGTGSPCGVVLSDCPPGECASVQIFGITQAEKSPSPPDIMVIPGFPNLPSSRCLVNLNSIGSDVYRNYFKAVPEKYDSDKRLTRIKIIDGGNPDNIDCGYTDLSSVSATTIDISSDCFIAMELIREDDTWKHKFKTVSSFNSIGETIPHVILAEIDRGKIIQRWTGGVVNWRDRFVIPLSKRRPS